MEPFVTLGFLERTFLQAPRSVAQQDLYLRMVKSICMSEAVSASVMTGEELVHIDITPMAEERQTRPALLNFDLAVNRALFTHSAKEPDQPDSKPSVIHFTQVKDRESDAAQRHACCG